MLNQNSMIIKAYAEWLKDYPWKYFIALHFKPDFNLVMKQTQAEQKVRQLCTRLNKFLNGINSSVKLSVFPVYEVSKAGVPHVHILLGAENVLNKSIDEIRMAVAYYWGKLTCCICPILMGEANGGWFTDTDNNKERVLEYMCKEFTIGRNPVLVGALKLPSTK